MKKASVIILMLLPVFQLIRAQELNCKVNVNTDQIQGTNQTVFTALQEALTSYMNDRQWTDYSYQAEERIECTVSIVVNSYANGVFDADLQIQSNRPVYGSTYQSPLFAHLDGDFAFNYNEGDVLQFSETSFGNNLTEVLAFYAYVIIGMDCDSFSPMGGTPFYQKAEQIVNRAQSSNEAGWKAFEDHRNRYSLINNFLDDLMVPFRQYIYTYHRLGLDQMSASPDKGRAEICNKILSLRDAYKSRPSAVALTDFAETKMDELVNICSKASSEEKQAVYDAMSVIVPTMTDRLDQLK